ncbi:MAG TPA: hypothetical protein VGA56_16715 [Opitutaceae bacterium]
MKSKLIALCALIFAFALTVPSAHAVCARVVTIQTDQLDQYVKELQRGNAIMKRAGSSTVLRAWVSRFSGPNTGAVHVVLEYPTMSALAADLEKLEANAEFTAWLKGLSSIRKVVSDSIMQELKL